jgi:uncharacterized membrane protein YidH (DUF202 family)
MKPLRSLSALAVLGLLSVAGVLVYNAWSYCSGLCTLGTFFTLGPAGGILLIGIAGTALTYAVLRFRRQNREMFRRCSCGEIADLNWSFCPHCGNKPSFD